MPTLIAKIRPFAGLRFPFPISGQNRRSFRLLATVVKLGIQLSVPKSATSIFLIDNFQPYFALTNAPLSPSSNRRAIAAFTPHQVAYRAGHFYGTYSKAPPPLRMLAPPHIASVYWLMPHDSSFAMFKSPCRTS